MNKAFKIAQKTLDFVILNKWTLLGLGGCYYLSNRMTSNMRELEQNTKDKKLFDPVKAKAQIEVYKEIYRMEANESLPEHERVQTTDGALRILQTADQNDAEEIAKFFQKKAG